MDSLEHDSASTARLLPAEELLIARAAQIDPRQAICWRGHYGEDFDLGNGEIQRVLSKALVWAYPGGADCVPDWAMKEAWPNLATDWEKLVAAAWERDQRHSESAPASPRVRAILALEPSVADLIDALSRVFAIGAASTRDLLTKTAIADKQPNKAPHTDLAD